MFNESAPKSRLEKKTELYPPSLDNSKLEKMENPPSFALLILKPLATESDKLRAEILGRLINEGKIAHMVDNYTATKYKVSAHYQDSSGKSFIPPLVEYMSNKAVTVIVLEGQESEQGKFIDKLRSDVIGPSDPKKAQEHHIRSLAIKYDLPYRQQVEVPKEEFIPGPDDSIAMDNLIHCSDSQESALREICIWFNDVPEVNQKYKDYFKEVYGEENLRRVVETIPQKH